MQQLTSSNSPLTDEEKIDLRRSFLDRAGSSTNNIHRMILDPRRYEGRVSPGGAGQSTVIFESVAEYRQADREGRSRYGGAEYGIVQTVTAARLCEKFAALHNGQGAVVLPSGLSAIKTVLETYLQTKDGRPTILIPQNRYYPTERVLIENIHALAPGLKIVKYPGNAGADEIENIVADLARENRRVNLFYFESPGSHTFEIADIDAIVRVLKRHEIKSVIDNTWAAFRFKPLEHGIDMTIQSTTKYEGGRGDTPSGIVIARSQQDFDRLSRAVRISGNGAVSEAVCRNLLDRVDSTEERMDIHYRSALEVGNWLQEQDFTGKIYCPFLPTSPDYGRFQQYFRKGNGLLTLEFKDDIPTESVDAFMDRLLIHRIGESWGGHVSLVLPSHGERAVRFSVGREDSQDLIDDIKQSAEATLA